MPARKAAALNANQEAAMFVGRRMTRNVVSVTKDASVLHVRKLLRAKDINQVPVVEGRRVIAVSTAGDIRE